VPTYVDSPTSYGTRLVDGQRFARPITRGNIWQEVHFPAEGAFGSS